MIRKTSFILICFILLINLIFVLANEPSVSEVLGGGSSLEQDVEKIQNIVEGGVNVYNPETGNFNPEALDSYFPKTKFEEKISEINSFFNKANSSWAPYIFGMNIEISWVFILNFYFILLFLVTFLFNAKRIFDVLNFNKDILYYVFGFVIFLIFLVTRLNLIFARTSLKIAILVWTKIIPIGFIVALIFIVLLIILFLFAPKMTLTIIKGINRLIKLFSNSKSKDKTKDLIEKSKEQINNIETFTKELSK